MLFCASLWVIVVPGNRPSIGPISDLVKNYSLFSVILEKTVIISRTFLLDPLPPQGPKSLPLSLPLSLTLSLPSKGPSFLYLRVAVLGGFLSGELRQFFQDRGITQTEHLLLAATSNQRRFQAS